jgi:hypothetical protein
VRKIHWKVNFELSWSMSLISWRSVSKLIEHSIPISNEQSKWQL